MKLPQFFFREQVWKTLCSSVSLFFICVLTQAQITDSTKLSKVNSYVDFGGFFHGGLASVNVEGRVFSGTRLTWYARAGVGSGGLDQDGGPGVLGAVTMLTGKDNNHFEVNGGMFIGKYSDVQDEFFFLPIIDLGYRYQKPEGGFIFRCNVGFLGIRFGLGHAF